MSRDAISGSGSGSDSNEYLAPRGAVQGEIALGIDYGDELVDALHASTHVCRFCRHSVNHPNYGSAMRICRCKDASRYMAHRGCFVAYMLDNGVPPVCAVCTHPWYIPPAEYLPFYHHKRKVKAWNLQVLCLRTLLAVGLFFAATIATAYLIKCVVYLVTGTPNYAAFSNAALTVHWEPGLGDLAVGTVANLALLVAAAGMRAIIRRCRRLGCVARTCPCCSYRVVYAPGSRPHVRVLHSGRDRTAARGAYMDSAEEHEFYPGDEYDSDDALELQDLRPLNFRALDSSVRDIQQSMMAARQQLEDSGDVGHSDDVGHSGDVKNSGGGKYSADARGSLAEMGADLLREAHNTVLSDTEDV